MAVVQVILTLGWIIAEHREQLRDPQEPGNDWGPEMHRDEDTP